MLTTEAGDARASTSFDAPGWDENNAFIASWDGEESVTIPTTLRFLEHETETKYIFEDLSIEMEVRVNSSAYARGGTEELPGSNAASSGPNSIKIKDVVLVPAGD